MNKRGFTLFEVIIYLALYSVLIGGAVVAAYNLVESGGHNETAALVDEEGGYLTSKIDWALSDEAGSNPVFAVTNGTMFLAWGSDAPQAISNSSMRVSDFLLATTSDGYSASFTLTALTPNGFAYAQTFSTTR